MASHLLSNRYVKITAALLALEAAAFHAYPKGEVSVSNTPLKQLPQQIGAWQMVEEYPIETEVQALLRADETLNRHYLNAAAGRGGSVFVAFFRTQRTGVSPHSPKVCLPGSGWTPGDDKRITFDVPGRPEPITVNRYIVSRGENKSVVLYWYQTHRRVIADEFAAKFYLVLDSMRFRRSDTSLVRFVVPVRGDVEQTEKAAIDMARDFFNPIRTHLPM